MNTRPKSFPTSLQQVADRWRSVTYAATDWWTLGASLLITMAVSTMGWRQDADAHRRQSQERADSVQRQINAELGRVKDLLAANEAFAAITFDLSAAAFGAFNQTTLQRHSALTQLQWLEWVADDDRFRFEFVTARELGRAFEIQAPTQGAGLARAATAPHYLVVKGGVTQPGYVLPEGLNVLFTPERLASYKAAIAHGKTLVSNVRPIVVRRKLGLEIVDKTEPGVIVSQPMYWYDMQSAGAQERLQYVRGFITLLIYPEQLLRETVVPLLPAGGSAYLAQEENGLWRSVAKVDSAGLVTLQLEGLDWVARDDDVVREAQLLDRTWRLVLREPPEDSALTQRWLQSGVIGVALTLLLAYALRRRRANLMRQAKLRQQLVQAQELSARNAELEERVAQRTEELSQSHQKLAHAQQELVRSERLASLGSMVAGVAHELNTPIGNGLMAVTTLQSQLTGIAQSLASGTMKRSSLEQFLGGAGEGLDLAQTSLKRASGLVSDFRDIAVPAERAQPSEVRLADAIAQALEASQLLIHSARIDCDVVCAADLCMQTSPYHLHHVLVAVLDNIVHHAFEPDERGKTHITASRNIAGVVQIAVGDTGCGIPANLLPRLFDPFFTTRMGQKHRGLGLHLAYAHVKLVLRGDITVTSVPGAGTVFTIALEDLA